MNKIDEFLNLFLDTTLSMEIRYTYIHTVHEKNLRPKKKIFLGTGT